MNKKTINEGANRSRKKRIIRTIFICLLVFFVIITSFFAVVYLNLNNLSKDAVQVTAGVASLPSEKPVVEKPNPEAILSDTEDILDLVAQKQNIFFKEKYADGVINVLLVGRDSNGQISGNGRSDTMMIISYNFEKRTAKLISLMRDSLVPVDSYGWTRLNHAFAYGGVGLCINTINACFDLDIQNYVIVDLDAMVELVDRIGGVDIKLNETEADFFRNSSYFGYWDVTTGMNHFTGERALIFARLRYIDSDFERTRRQRDVMQAIYTKIYNEVGIIQLSSLVNSAFDMVETNLTPAEILALAAGAISGDLQISQARVPEDGTWTYASYNGMSILDINIPENTEYLHSLIWGEITR